MRNMKKFVALALATTMVLGNSLTAFAEETNTGNSTGAGTSEGHVDKKATNVVLPTEVANSTFAYTMDPERLIVETSHEKYGDAVEFPASNDTGVYFNNGPKGGDGADKDNVIYANTSKALDVVNKSSHSIDLTVKAEAVAGNNDIPLVAQSDITDAEAASLYLGLKVGSAAAETVLADTAATKTVSIAGTVGNFKTAVKNVDGVKSYEYRALTLAEYKALAGNSEKTQAEYDATWAKTSFNLEGEVTRDLQITSSTTAPSVKVTWSWVDPSANAAPSITPTSGILSSSAIEINYNLGLGDDAATSVTGITFGDTNKNDSGTVASSFYTVDAENNKITLSADYMAILANDGYTTVKFTIAFDNNKTASIVLTAEGD